MFSKLVATLLSPLKPTTNGGRDFKEKEFPGFREDQSKTPKRRKRQRAQKKKRITELRQKKISGFLPCLDMIVIYWNGLKDTSLLPLISFLRQPLPGCITANPLTMPETFSIGSIISQMVRLKTSSRTMILVLKNTSKEPVWNQELNKYLYST